MLYLSPGFQLPALDATNVLRYVEIDSQVVDVQPYRLLTWDTGGTRPDNGRSTIGVACYLHTDAITSPTLVTYVSLGAGRHADDSDESLVAALSAVCMRPGDTDEEYFADYTPRALAWAESWHCEALGIIPYDAESARCDWQHEAVQGCVWMDVVDEHGHETERLVYPDENGDIEGQDGKSYSLVFRDLLDW